ncbi:MAG: malto-oligosyltrehalose synthase [Candidatus Manganitrophaceae bacterium]|nr:MAG: malto-oligosyltrehalose synthase [Candidatus Manganitrophaceae bacterium]
MSQRAPLEEDRIDPFIQSFIQSLSDLEIAPTSTYRVQFNYQFRFPDAAQIIPYLNDLGITHLYASPYLQARPKSLHGYDICNHNALNPEIGSETDHAEMIDALRRHHLGHILDIVPNHMGVTENQWWLDVLENGRNSPYAHYFDIDWHPIKKELSGKVLLPVLGNQYGQVLESQDLQLRFSAGAFWITYYDNRFPVSPRSYPKILRYRLDALEKEMEDDPENIQEYHGITLALLHLPVEIQSDPQRIAEERRQIDWIKRRLAKLYQGEEKIRRFIDENVAFFNGKKGEPRSFDLLDQLLNEQSYRLSYWRVASDEINYRRFFDVNELASISMERKEVFEETHQLLFRLIREGKLDGLRVDHPDGLFDPIDYFRRLQKRCWVLRGTARIPEGTPEEVKKKVEEKFAEAADRFLASRTRPGVRLPFYVVVEKILSKGERLPERWPVHGTVGYEYLNAVNALFVDSRHAKRFDQIYADFIGTKSRFSDIVYERKKFIMNTTMASEINVLSHRLNRLSEKDRLSRDFTLYSLRDAIREVIACFPIYRTYITRFERLEEHDRKFVEMAVTKAKQRSPATDISIFDYLKRTLFLQYPEYFTEEDRREQLAFVQKFQQCTGPIMAKGLEDTAFYVYNRLVSLNEVGGDPQTFGISAGDFHKQNAERLERWPYSMLTTSTHDTKRSEDVRARINVLSEMPEEWQAAATRWADLNRSKKVEIEGEPAPDANEEYLLYQTLLGAWPLRAPSPNEYQEFKKRIQAYMTKASKEAKVNTSWISPNEAYDQALSTFIEAILDPGSSTPFLEDFNDFQKTVSHFGIFNSLSQTLLKIASPGVPDLYQGCELFDLSLVDPDNRRPVDYPLRIRRLEEIKKEMMSDLPSPLLIQRLLREKEEGLIKLFVTWRALNCRREHRRLFLNGAYLPREAAGPAREHLIAFSRRLNGEHLIVAAPRLLVSLIDRSEDPIGAAWEGSDLLLEDEPSGVSYRNVLTGERVEGERENGKVRIPLASIFQTFPLGLLMEQIDG